MLKISNSNQITTGEKVTIHLDKYSKLVLSVIAVCLMLIAVNMYFSPTGVNADTSAETIDVNIKSVNGSSISGSYLPVDIQRIDGSSSKELRVDLRSINGRNIFGERIPVDITGINGQFFMGGDLPVRVR